jgi:hypothetical protein
MRVFPRIPRRPTVRGVVSPTYSALFITCYIHLKDIWLLTTVDIEKGSAVGHLTLF